MDVDVVPSESPVDIAAVESCSYVQLEAITFSYAWSCTDIRFVIEGDDSELKSPMFSYGDHDEPKFKIVFKFGGEDPNGYYYYGVYLELVLSDEKEVQAKFKFAFINANGEKVNEKDSKGIRILRPAQPQGRTKFIEYDLFFQVPNQLLIDSDNFQIFCEVTVYRKSTLFKTSNSNLSDDLGHLFANEKFSDVTLSVNGYDYNVHKNILAARSPVFRAMLKNNMEERKTGKVIITDIDNDVVKEMLRFIYTGRSLSLDKMAEELLIAADKYQLETLKGECQKVLCKSLSIENAPKILMLAEVLHADQLKADTIDFITSNVSDIMDTDEFKNMFKSHPQLIAAAFRALATKSMSKTFNS